MPSARFLILGLCAIVRFSLAAADDSTVSLFLPGFPGSLSATSVVASIVGANDTVRTYDVACLSGDEHCSLPTPFTLVQGINTLTYTVTKSDTTCTMECSFTDPTGSCHAQVTAPMSVGVLDNQIGSVKYAIASITGGLSYLSASLASAAPMGAEPQSSAGFFPTSSPAANFPSSAEQSSSSISSAGASAGTPTSDVHPPRTTSAASEASSTSNSVGLSSSNAGAADLAGVTGLGGAIAAVALAAAVL